MMTVGSVHAADLEAEAWPEIDIWVKMDDIGKDRIFILASFADEPSYQYQETALGVSWDRRMNKHWSWRAVSVTSGKKSIRRTRMKPVLSWI